MTSRFAPIAFLLVASLSVAGADDDGLRARFLAECKESQKALSSRLTRVRGERVSEVFLTRYDPKTAAAVRAYFEALEAERKTKQRSTLEPPVIPIDELPTPDVRIRRGRHRFALDGESYRFDTTEFDEWTFDPSTPEVAPVKKERPFYGSVSFGSPESYTRLTRKSPGGDWVVEDYRKSGSRAGHAESGLRSLYAIWSTPFVAIMEHPSFRILKIASVRDGDENAVRVEFDYDPGGKDPTRGGWVVLLPDRLWAIRRSEVRYTEPHLVHRSEVEYVPTPGDPTPRRASVLARTQLLVSSYDNVTYEPTPPSEFTLASFGLPEMGRPAPALADESPRAAYWVIAAAVACLVAAIVLRRLARRPGEVVAS